jgi:ATP-dependent Clp protease ATP-binding subunit ClpB
MNLNQFTIKAQESIANAQNIASTNSHQAIENGHILKSLILSDDKVAEFLLGKLGVNLSLLNTELDNIISTYPKVSGGDAPFLARNAQNTLNNAIKFAKDNSDESVTIEHILFGIVSGNDNVSKLLKDNGVKEKDLQSAINNLRGGSKVNAQNAESTYNALNKYAKNLNDLARTGKLDPVIGREEEIRRVIQILSRRTKNNPILIGEPGVGKTAIAEGIAFRIINKDVPETLQEKTIYSLDLGALVAGAKYKGEFEERLKAVVKEVTGSDGQIVLFIDEIHTLVGAGGGEGAMDAANILKPALARGELRAIGATTLNEYQKYFEKDKALERRFQKVIIDEPTVEDAISILRGLKERYENYHKLRIKDEAIISAVQLSHRYITDRFLPDKAIDLIDEASARARIEADSMPEELDEIERRIRQLEIEKEAIKREKDEAKLEKIASDLSELNDKRNEIRGKWLNEKELTDTIQNLKQNIENYKIEAQEAERRGDYGKVAELRYGKIREAEDLLQKKSDELKNRPNHEVLVKEEVDAEDIAAIVSRWTGIPVTKMMQTEREKLLNMEQEIAKRVVGQKEALEAVSDAVRRNRSGLGDAKKPIGSFIFIGTTGVGKTELAKALAEFLFDDEAMMTRIDMSEYQERHSVSRLIGAPPGYVGYEEGGQLTEAVRRKPYSVVLLDEIEKAHPDVFNILLQVLEDGRLTDNKGRVVNFKNSIVVMTSNLGSDIIRENYANANQDNMFGVEESTRLEVMELLKKSFRPEFLNRIDEIIMFKPLDNSQIEQIVSIQLLSLAKSLKENEIDLVFTDEAVKYLSRLGYEPEFGARPLKRLIQKQLINKLSKSLIAGEIDKNKTVKVDALEEVGIFFTNQ